MSNPIRDTMPARSRSIHEAYSTASVPPKPRDEKNRDLPRNLYEDGGYYTYRNPRTGDTFKVGTEIQDPAARRAFAISEAKTVNAWLDKPQAPLIERIDAPPPTRTIAAFIPTYRERLDERELAGLTLYNRKRQLVHIERELGSIGIGPKQEDAVEITRKISDWLRVGVKSGKRRTAQAYRATLSDMFAEMAAAGWIAVNPVEVLRLPTPKVRRARLTLEDFWKIYEAAEQLEPWVRRSMELGIVSLQRREDVAVMGFRDQVDARLKVEQGKTGVRIRIPLELRLNAVGWSFDEIIKRCRDNVVSRYLVHHTRNQGQASAGECVHPQTITGGFREARELAGIVVEEGKTPPTFHELRSLGARLYLRQGYNPQDLMGHKREETTAIYTDNRGAEWIDVAA